MCREIVRNLAVWTISSRRKEGSHRSGIYSPIDSCLKDAFPQLMRLTRYEGVTLAFGEQHSIRLIIRNYGVFTFGSRFQTRNLARLSIKVLASFAPAIGTHPSSKSSFVIPAFSKSGRAASL